jgi:hypothetical protein
MTVPRYLTSGLAALTAAGLIAAVPAPADAAGGTTITKVYVNSPGKDTGSNKSLNAEYVKIKNTSSKGKSLKGWTIRYELSTSTHSGPSSSALARR